MLDSIPARPYQFIVLHQSMRVPASLTLDHYFVSLYLKEHHAVYIHIFIPCEVNIHVYILIFYLVILIYTFVNCLFMVSVHFSIGMFTFSIDS